MSMDREQGVFALQPDANLIQAAPVQNTWYTVLDTKKNVKIYGISMCILTTGETLEMRITIDGQPSTLSYACIADTDYSIYKLFAPNTTSFDVATGLYLACYTSPLEAKSVKVEIRKTTAAGAGDLLGHVTYGKRGDG